MTTETMTLEQAETGRGAQTLTGRLVARNVFWNVVGQAAPIVAAVVSIPILARALGTDRFGLLALSWTFVGYFGIFDLGLGQAMTRSVAQKLAADDGETINVTVWTTMSAMLALGVAGLGVAWALTPTIIHALRTTSELQGEALLTIHLLALSIPLVITSVALRGVLEAHLKFKLVNAVRIPLGMWTYIGPIIVLPFSHSLVLIVGVLLLGRVAGFLVYALFCLSVVPSLRRVALHWKLVRPLLTFGGWLTLDNIIDPLTNFLDRFLIGTLVSLTAVAYYSVPYELAAKAWVLPVALSGVLFPTFTRLFVRDGHQVRLFFSRGVKYLLFAMFPLTLILVSLAQPGLQFWIGGGFAAQSTSVLQLLAIGVMVTSLGSVADTFIQSAGRPDVSAKLALGKFAVHFLPAWWVISTYGIVGLAALWVTTTGIEALGMFIVALRLQGIAWTSMLLRFAQSVPMWLLLAVATLALPLAWRLAYVATVIAGMALIAWRRLMSPGERNMVRSRLHLRALAASSGRM